MNAYLAVSAVGVVLGLFCLGAAGLCFYYKKKMDAESNISFPLLIGATIISGAALVAISIYFLKTKRNHRVSPRPTPSPYDEGSVRKNVSMDFDSESPVPPAVPLEAF